MEAREMFEKASELTATAPFGFVYGHDENGQAALVLVARSDSARQLQPFVSALFRLMERSK
jgi:hypothetical protein